jgi:hypothetical protein
VLRYEIKNITPPHDVLAAMEKQMRAEREKRAVILTSEGARDANINNAEGEKQQVIKASEARRQQQINEAEGQAQAILAVAKATAEGIRQVADAIRQPGGLEATQLRVAEHYLTQFGGWRNQRTMILANVTGGPWSRRPCACSRRRSGFPAGSTGSRVYGSAPRGRNSFQCIAASLPSRRTGLPEPRTAAKRKRLQLAEEGLQTLQQSENGHAAAFGQVQGGGALVPAEIAARNTVLEPGFCFGMRGSGVGQEL